MPIAVFLTGMIEKFQAENPPIYLGTWKREVIKRKADEHETGIMTLETLNMWFEQKWPKREDFFAEGKTLEDIERREDI